MGHNVSGWVLDKIFLEVRFDNSAKFIENKDDLLRRYIARYPQYKTEPIETLALANPKLQRTITFSMNRVVVDFDRLDTFDEFVTEIKLVSQDLSSILGVSGYEFVGVRGYWGQQMKRYDALELMKKHMISVNEKWHNVGKLQDAALRLTFHRGKLKFHVSISPVLVQLVQFQAGRSTVSNDREMLMADIDIHIPQVDGEVDLVQFALDYQRRVQDLVLPAILEG